MFKIVNKGYQMNLIVKDLEDKDKSKLVLSRYVAYIVTPRKDKQIILIKNYLDEFIVPIGVAKDLESALRYIETLNTDCLEQVA
jgi:hypothetical protein